MSDALEKAYLHARRWMDEADTRAVGASASAQQLRKALSRSLPQTPTPADVVIDELAAGVLAGNHNLVSGRFYACVMGSSHESALAADWLVSAWDQNSAMFACAPGAAVIEEVAGEWIKELLDLPREASFAFTTGCQLAHMTSLAAARSAVLTRAGFDVNEAGLVNCPPVRLIVNQQSHGSVERALRFLGFGQRQVVVLPTNERSELEVETLAAALQESDAPTIVVLNAADLNIAAFDPFAELIPLAHKHGAWVHVDGAFGLFARASRKTKHLTAGVELADSWATDAHKWLNVPFDGGISIVRDAAAHRAAMTTSASYLTASTDVRDQIDWNPEWSRRARAVPIYAALHELGVQGVEAMVDRGCEQCLALVDGVAALPGARAVVRPTLNQGLLRFEREGDSDSNNDAFTDEVIAAINATGEAFFSGSTWHGRRVMRVSVVNFRTDAVQVKRTIAAVADVLGKLL